MSSCCHNGPVAALLGLVLTAGCTNSDLPTEPPVGVCQAAVTPIATVQGEGFQSPLLDSNVSVRGVVTRVEDNGGFYIEDGETSPQQQRGSRALFITSSAQSTPPRVGQQLALSGLVSESGESTDTVTSLTEITNHEVCAEQFDLPSTSAKLPLSPEQRELLESMRLVFEQELTVTDVYRLHAGAFTLSSNGVLRVPTEIRMPGPAAVQQEKENRSHAIVAILPAPVGPVPLGSTTGMAAGILGHDGRGQQLLLDEAPELSAVQPAPLAPPADGLVRIVNSNLLNFFNGDGRGGGFPGERGAESLEEFKAQSARTKAAMARIQPDLLAVQELENDGFGEESAATALLTLLNQTGHQDWAFIAPGADPIGGDVITVGLFYRRQVLEAVGKPHLLDGPEFRALSRQPLAQVFRDRRSGSEFLVAVNHLKSKGRCPDQGKNADQQDGQNCWNFARVSAVDAQMPWLQKLAAEMNTENLLILGDMNAWRNEDPIRRFADFGVVDLVQQLSGLPQHSFLFWGATGTLDYAFASPSLALYATHAVNWHVNADYPRKMEQAQPWLRASDHDPVIVDFDFSQSRTSD